MNILTLETAGFYPAIQAMRNPLNSWNRNDTQNTENGVILGEKDRQLSQKLTNAGSEHCKHLRMVHVWVDMTLPRYIHSEMDTYKFNTHISCSTMHTVHKRYLRTDDFQDGDVSDNTLGEINHLIDIFNSLNKEDTEKRNEIRSQIKKKLPEGFLQLRTYDFNYSELLNIYLQRKNHKLKEWRLICNWILDLPYFKELTGIGD